MLKPNYVSMLDNNTIGLSLVPRQNQNFENWGHPFGFETENSVKISLIFKIPEFLIVGCYNNVPDVFRHIVLKTVTYIYSINTFVRQNVCAHKRHIILTFSEALFEKPQYLCAICVHILFVSKLCLLSVYNPHYWI